MTRQLSPFNQRTVPVIDRDGILLTPTRPSRARRWIETGKARKAWVHGHFAVQLSEEYEDAYTPEMHLGINPGSRTTGMAVVIQEEARPATVAAGIELKHQGHTISQKMHTRSSHRRNRRSRLRRRPARFNNRTRKQGWLPPSMQSKLSNVTTTIRHLRTIFPITRINLEAHRFDPRLMQDPGITGEEYQHSERGEMQIREYVLQRDNRTCQYRQKCQGGKQQRLETDHIVPESRGGTYRISNLITACRQCNKAKDNRSIDEFLAHDPERLRSVQAQMKKSLASATHINQLVPLLREALLDTGLPVTETDAVTTAWTRKKLGIPKTSVNDAACLGGPEGINAVPERITVLESVGHGSRQMLTSPSRYGTPRYKPGPTGKSSPYRAYCRMPRSIQGFTTTPGHKLRRRRIGGITSGDLIRYFHKKDGPVEGYATLEKAKSRASASGRKSVHTSRVTLLARGNGYRQESRRNEEQRRTAEPNP